MPKIRDPRLAKRRDMARSVLPSSKRRAARQELTAVRRRHRRAVSLVLHDAARAAARCLCAAGDGPDDGSGDAGGALDCPRCSLDVHVDYPLTDHLEAVRDRRGADKLGPLLAWARHHADRLVEEDRRVALRQVLPDGVIGWHAMSHLVSDGLVPSGSPYWYELLVPAVPAMPLAPRLEAAAGALLAAGRHGELNAWARSLTWGGVGAERVRAASNAPERFARAYPFAWAAGPEGVSEIWWRPLHGGRDLASWAADVAGHLEVRRGGGIAALEALVHGVAG